MLSIERCSWHPDVGDVVMFQNPAVASNQTFHGMPSPSIYISGGQNFTVRVDRETAFDEFVFTTCMVCTMNKEDMLHILFEIFDVDNNEQISVREFRKLCAAVSDASDAIFPGNYSNMLEKFDRNHDGALSFKEFVLALAEESYWQRGMVDQFMHVLRQQTLLLLG